jgi:hypothetical protein
VAQVSDETWQLIAAAVATMAQLYMVEPWKFPVFAAFWDTVAQVCGELANLLAWISMQARANYYSVISESL